MNTLPKSTSCVKNIALGAMRVSPVAQRRLRPHRVEKIFSQFAPERLGVPVVSFRDNVYWIVDGQHRIEALKAWLGSGWEKQVLLCLVHTGMTEQQEADLFDHLNNTSQVNAFDKFKVRIVAAREVENEVNAAVAAAGLVVALGGGANNVSAVSTLVKVFVFSDAPTLTRTLRLVCESFGKPGLTANVILGMAGVCRRYNEEMDDVSVVAKLRGLRGGVGELLSRAALLKRQLGRGTAECMSAAILEVINSKRGGKKLPAWWSEAA